MGAQLPKLNGAEESPLAASASDIQYIEEDRVCRQIANIQCLAPIYLTTRENLLNDSLPCHGQLDHLLQPGHASDLFSHLTAGFRQFLSNSSGSPSYQNGHQHLPFREPYMEKAFSPDAIVKHLRLATTFWDPEPRGNFLELVIPPQARLLIVGDTYGQLADVLWIFFKYGKPSRTNRYLFLGNVVDHGACALEILLLLFAFKRDQPGSVQILRGNHEDVNSVLHHGFKRELENKFADQLHAVWGVCTNVVFPLMPVAAVISDESEHYRFAAFHGGIPAGVPEHSGPLSVVADLGKIDRRRRTVQHARSSHEHILHKMLWSCPIEGGVERMTGPRTAPRFTERDTRDFCRHNNVAFVVRSHEVPTTLRGALQTHSGLCYTVFSASNYLGCVGNRGGVLMCNGGASPLHVLEHWAPPSSTLSEILSGAVSARDSERQRVVGAWESYFGIESIETPQIDKISANWYASHSASQCTATAGGSPKKFGLSLLARALTERTGHGQQGAQPPTPVDSERQTNGLTDKHGMESQGALAQQHAYLCNQKAPVAAEFPWSWQGPRIGTKAPPVHAMDATAEEHWVLFICERVVELKGPLFNKFRTMDTLLTGVVSRKTCANVMLSVLTPQCGGVLSPALIQKCFAAWALPFQVQYIRFLHRFQLKADLPDRPTLIERIRNIDKTKPGERKVHEALHFNMELMLHTDGDKPVTCDEFITLLPTFGIRVPPWQAAILYEKMCELAQQNPISVDSTIVCLALANPNHFQPKLDVGRAQMLEVIWHLVCSEGTSVPALFRTWDSHGTGFLSIDELEEGLRISPVTWGITEKQLNLCISKLNSMGVPAAGVNVFDFVRALAPPSLAMQLQRILIEECLLQVWVCRPALVALLAAKDPAAHNQVTREEFQECLDQVNAELGRMGHWKLTDAQVNMVCDIAAAGEHQVRYSLFLSGLQIQGPQKVSSTSSNSEQSQRNSLLSCECCMRAKCPEEFDMAPLKV